MTPETESLVREATAASRNAGVSATELVPLIQRLTQRLVELDPSTEDTATTRMIDMAEEHNLSLQIFGTQQVQEHIDDLKDDDELGATVCTQEQAVMDGVKGDAEWPMLVSAEAANQIAHDALCTLVERAAQRVHDTPANGSGS